ncbi:hypothetical protein HN832_02595 [archaeon]|jgi:hypothetical protein|nr:hypothetical protein [archaeon]MBT4373243.1 hypothetical protein [archaeon]MBT4531588.1 hypothetical protein [archaeon]MBT7001234.1 hypothetical protein [archaeon]MBT7282280.1 hypothetical protein [archaeon]
MKNKKGQIPARGITKGHENLFEVTKGHENPLPRARTWGKNAQEEIVGFVLIMIIVAVLLVIFIGFSLRNSQKENVESYEVESFIQSSLQYTTNCEDNFEYLSMEKLIFRCIDNEVCLNGQNSCQVLDEIFRGMLKEGWRIENRPLEGYDLKIEVDGQELIPSIFKGNLTKNYKGAVQDFTQSGRSVQILFRAYY